MDQLKDSLNSSLVYFQNIDIVKILLATLIFGSIYISESIFISLISITSYSLYLFLKEEKHFKNIVIFESVFMLFYYIFFELTETWGCFGGYINYEENIYYFIIFLLRTIIFTDLFKIKLKRHVVIFIALFIVSIKINLFPNSYNPNYQEQDWEREMYYDYNEPIIEEAKKIAPLEGQYFAELEYWKDSIRDFESIIIDIHADSIIFESKNINNRAFVRSETKHNFGDDYSFYLLQDGTSIPIMINHHEGFDFAEIQLFNIMGFNKINTISLKSKIPDDFKYELFQME